MPRNLFAKYDRPGPRYTSYPALPFWGQAPSEEVWFKHLNESLSNDGHKLDMYLHIPYCESLCYYCGCNRTITKDKNRGDDYVQYLLKEWEIYLKNFNHKTSIYSLHLGGGTPTFLRPETLHRLLDSLSPYFHRQFLGSIEIDPRTVTTQHLKVLKEFKFDRISLGIQDFNLDVQKSIHRIQPFELVKKLVNEMRCMGFSSLNFDLIYGLPKQTVETVLETMNLVLELKPDVLACYSYAHLPLKISNQKLINENDLPQGKEKRVLFETMSHLLLENDFESIGMDHFSRPHGYLSKAKRTHTLGRNFMGYVDHKSKVLLGLGVTSISDSGLSFMQNQKDIDQYVVDIRGGQLTIEKGHILDLKDLHIKKMMMDFMCYGYVSKMKLGELLGNEEMAESFNAFVQENILAEDQSYFQLTDYGLPFLRNVAMAIDPYFQNQKITSFSKTI